jgi:dienelactone hydrolase
MKASIDWITKQAGQGQYANVDAKRIVAAGFSCGGVEAYDQIWDSRIMGIGIWSSGLLTNQTAASNFRKPIFFFMGGQSDIAFANVSYEH